MDLLEFLIEVFGTLLLGIFHGAFGGKKKKRKLESGRTTPTFTVPKKRKKAQECVVMKYNSELKGLCWFLGILVAVSCTPSIFLLALKPEISDMSKQSNYIVIGLLSFLLSLTILSLVRLTSYRIKISKTKLLIRSLFLSRKIALSQITRVTESNYKNEAIFAYIRNKKVLTITRNLTNFEPTKKFLLNYSKDENAFDTLYTEISNC